MKYVKFCFEQEYEASESITKIALVESTLNQLYEWYYDFYSSKLGNEMNTPTRLGGIDDNLMMILMMHLKINWKMKHLWRQNLKL